MTRIAHNDHKAISIVPGDYIIFSSRIIPGNERSVGRLINQFHRYGAKCSSGRLTPSTPPAMPVGKS